MNATVKVIRNGIDGGLAGVYNDVDQSVAISKFETHKSDYLKLEKKDKIKLELVFDGKVIESWDKP